MNREKVIFLTSALLLSGALYCCISSRPRALPLAEPIAYGQMPPRPLALPRASQEPHPANSDRANPFAPYAKTIVKRENGGIIAPAAGPEPVPFRIDPLVIAPAQDFPVVPLESALQFVGVARLDGGETFGLLKPNDGSPMIRVKEGSELG